MRPSATTCWPSTAATTGRTPTIAARTTCTPPGLLVHDGADQPPEPGRRPASPRSRRSRRSTRNEASDIRKIRDYRVNIGGKTLRPLRGEFHRHTEFSSHNDQDGLLEDTWRYALDAADHDWMGNGDHDNGFGHEYMWWLIQKMADLHLNPPRFVAAQTYERSVVYPNGHRNVIMPRRGIRPLPRGEPRRARPRPARPTPSCSTPT